MNDCALKVTVSMSNHWCHAYERNGYTIPFSHDNLNLVYKYLRRHPIIKRKVLVTVKDDKIVITNR